ncbi:MAG: hypothetical protein LBM93_03260 [Oscillospiraceae bacterium]|nr:hypothetical protein [Oscillospiraceae bacterium]
MSEKIINTHEVDKIVNEFFDGIFNPSIDNQKKLGIKNIEKQQEVVEQMIRIFYGDKKKVYYYLKYMERVLVEIQSEEEKGVNKYDIILLVAKKGLIVFRAFLKYAKYAGWINNEELFMINSRTMCNYDFRKIALWRKKKEIKDLKIFIFDDTLNQGRNILNILNALKNRGILSDNITCASPTISNKTLKGYKGSEGYDEQKEKGEKIHRIFVDLEKIGVKEKIVKEDKVGIYHRKIKNNSCDGFVQKPSNWEYEAELFVPQIFENEEIESRYTDFGRKFGFVDESEIVSRAYQLNQFAHYMGKPYTAYLAHVKSTLTEDIKNKIDELGNNDEVIAAFKKDYPMFEVRDVRIKVCSTIGKKSKIIILDVDTHTGAYTAVRVFQDPNGETVFFPAVVQKTFDKDELRTEYKRFFDGAENNPLFKKELIHNITDEEWENGFGYFRKDVEEEATEDVEKTTSKLVAYNTSDETGCTKDNIGEISSNGNYRRYNCETAYARLKAVYECAARRLANLKSGLVLYDFFLKMKDTGVIGDDCFNELVGKLSKCMLKQFVQKSYKTKIKTMTDYLAEIYKDFRGKYPNKRFCDLVRAEKKEDKKEKNYIKDIYLHCGFKCHPHDDGSSYKVLREILDEYNNTPYRKIKNSNNIKDYYYLIFCQQFGAFFNNLKNKDKTDHKLPPLSTHYLINMIVNKVNKGRELEELDIENSEEDKDILVSCISALLSVFEDGFGGSVVYAEPLGNCPQSSNFYMYTCVQHGENPIQVNELFFSDFLCLHSLLEYSINDMYIYLGKIDDRIAEDLRKRVVRLVKKFVSKYSKDKENRYKDFIEEINKFAFYIDSSFSPWNSGKYEKYDISHEEKIYRSEMYEEESPEFEFKYNIDENTDKFINDIYEVKRNIRSYIIERKMKNAA